MYEMTIDDAGTLLLCHDGMATVPCPTDEEPDKTELFVNAFNLSWSRKAAEGSLRGVRAIIVDCDVADLPF